MTRDYHLRRAQGHLTRLTAALALSLITAASVPWCCLVPSQHHRGIHTASAAHSNHSSHTPGGTAATESSESAAHSPLCTLTSAPSRLDHSIGHVLSSLHAGWHFAPQSMARGIGYPGDAVGASPQDWRPPIWLTLQPDTPPPRYI